MNASRALLEHKGIHPGHINSSVAWPPPGIGDYSTPQFCSEAEIGCIPTGCSPNLFKLLFVASLLFSWFFKTHISPSGVCLQSSSVLILSAAILFTLPMAWSLAWRLISHSTRSRNLISMASSKTMCLITARHTIGNLHV